MVEKIDIWSKGEVTLYLLKLSENGQIKNYRNMGSEFSHANAYYPRCGKDLASRVEAKNVHLDAIAYKGPISYWWPRSPKDCHPHYEQFDNFLLTVSNDQFDEGPPVVVEDSEESKTLKTNQTIIVTSLPYPEKVTLK